MTHYEIHHTSGEWSAVYTNGVLSYVGDTENAVEHLLAALGVAEVHDDAFMRGQSQRDGVAETLAEVATYRAERAAASTEVQRLRDEADRALASAAD